MNKKKLISAIVVIILAIASIIFKVNFTDEQVSTISNTVETVVDVVDTVSATTEIPTLTSVDEQTVEVQEVENEGFEQQGEIAYNGSDKTPDVKIGEYQGLTYYSQVDNRWKNTLFTAIGDNSQTIGSSGCGPTSASMVVSSIRGTITPNEMANLYVQYGYRSANAGTYWSAFKWTADVFDIGYTETSNLDTAVDLARNRNYVIVSCGSGLFTYGGHYIVIVGVEGNNFKIYDPYLYAGKFDVSSRKGKVSVEGNTVYCSIDNFRNYANAKGFFCFKNDRTDTTVNTTEVKVIENVSNVTSTNYNVKITAKSGLIIRSGASTNYSRIGAYTYNKTVTILAESNGWGKTADGWIKLSYASKIETAQTVSTNYTAGTYKINCNRLNVRTGPGTNYKIKTLSQLTRSARAQGGYVNGVICTVLEVKGSWGKTPSGWICLDYCIKIK